MKKNLFKLLSMALVVCMVLSLGVTAFADDLTEADKDKVQLIYSGGELTYTPDDGEVNIQWGAKASISITIRRTMLRSL